MIHQPLGGVQGQASDIEIEPRRFLNLRENSTQSSVNTLIKHLRKVWNDSDRNYWMTSEEAKEYGMIDEV